MSQDNVYDLSKLIKVSPIPLWKRYLLRAMIPISFAKILIRALTTPQDKNVLHHDKLNNLTGKKVTAFSEPIDFEELKLKSRSLGCTLNDVMMSALVLAVSRYFKDKNDSSTSFNIIMPASIRWDMY